MNVPGKRWALFGVIAGTVALGAAVIGGVALAQTGGGSGPGGSAAASPTPNPRRAQMTADVDNFLNDLATNLKIDRNTLDSALKTTAKQEIDKAVKDGRLTQAEGDEAKQAVDSGKFPLGFAGGIGRFDRRGDFAALQGCMTGVQAAVQSVTGETPDQLRTDLRSGKTLDQILSAKGKTQEDLRNAVAASLQTCLDAAVKAGTLTSQQEQQIIDGVKNGKGPGIPGIFGGVGGPGGHRGPAGPNRRGTPTPGGTQ